MVTSVYIDYLTDYRNRLNNWLNTYSQSHMRLDKAKGARLNSVQMADHLASTERRNAVVNEVLRAEREIESLKISTNSIFKL